MPRPYPATLCAMFWELIAQLDCRPRQQVAAAIAWFGTPLSAQQFNSHQRSTVMAEGHAKVGEFIPLVLKFTKADGTEASLPDDPSITVSDPTLAELVEGANGLPYVHALAQGAVTVTVNQDGDPGPDESIITLVGTILINDPSDDATTGSLEFGPAETDPRAGGEPTTEPEPAPPVEEPPAA